jgi:hypothetical protein
VRRHRSLETYSLRSNNCYDLFATATNGFEEGRLGSDGSCAPSGIQIVFAKIDFPLFPLQLLVEIASVSYVVSCDTPMRVTFITLFVTFVTFVTLCTSCVEMVIKYCRHISTSSHLVPPRPTSSHLVPPRSTCSTSGQFRRES